MEEEAMYIWFEGVDGTWAWRGVRGEAALPAGESDRAVTEAAGCAL